MSSAAIADTIKSRTEALLRKSRTAVSSKPIIMRAEYAHCPNLTIIDTPGFVLKVCPRKVDIFMSGMGKFLKMVYSHYSLIVN